MKKEAGKLLGFRSDTPWKKGIALIYYGSCFVFFMIAMITPPLIPASSADTVITKISSFILTLMLLSPALFLSDTFLRNTLPFFKVKSFLSSLTGLLIVWAFLMYFFLCSESPVAGRCAVGAGRPCPPRGSLDHALRRLVRRWSA